MDVFGYASLVDHGDRVALLPGYRCVWGVAMDNRDEIPGYKYYVDAQSGERPDVCVAFLDLTPDPSRQVAGVLFEASPADLELLDRRERNYRREQVALADGVGSAWAYFGLGRSRRRCVAALKSGAAVVDRNYYDAVREGFSRLGALARFEASAGEPPCPVVDLRRVEIP
jgi:hypothetical protein